MRNAVYLIWLALLLGGCVSIPKQIAATNLSTATPNTVREGGAAGERVRWGGSILEVKPVTSETCFTVLSRPLDSSARPQFTDRNEGRFIACGSGLYDPAVFTKDRDITFVGTVEGTVPGKIGDQDYRFPKLRIESAYLWPPAVYAVPPYYYYDPWWPGPWGPAYWWGPYWGPWYGPGMYYWP